MKKNKGFTLIELMIVIAIIAIIAAIAIPGLLRSTIASNEKSALGWCRNQIQEESQWRSNDRDRNGVNDFWVADVCGMYRIERRPTASGLPLGADLGLQIDVARADGDPFTPAGGVFHPTEPVNLLAVVPILFAAASPPRAKAGYLYEAMVNDEIAGPYIPVLDTDGQGLNCNNVNKFGFVAYPEAYQTSGLNTYIVDAAGTVFKGDLGAQIAAPYNYSHPGMAAVIQPPWGTVD